MLPHYMTDYRNHWIADPGIDLFGEEATIVRAFIESDAVVESSGDSNQAYPGFTRATADTRGTISNDRRYGNRPGTPPRTYRGTSINRILSIEDIQPEYRGDSTVVVYVCTDAYDTDYDGRQPDWYRPPSGSHEIRMHNTTPSPPGTVYPLFEGPRNAPKDDVFGGWIVDKYTNATSNRAQQDLCSEWFKSRHDGKRLRAWNDFTPPLVLPNYPGWPDDNDDDPQQPQS
ncbi:hypothetical protein [Rhodococcus sp. 27YEA15]|uniref:hypothetical protein n=1 Tax=Rhodococcus sp. 27YEA15 TaxID=3156259 RepID=UPI003C7B6A83